MCLCGSKGLGQGTIRSETGQLWAQGTCTAAHHRLLPTTDQPRAPERGKGLGGFRRACPAHLAARGPAELQLCLSCPQHGGSSSAPAAGTACWHGDSLLAWGQPLRALQGSWAGCPCSSVLQACAVAPQDMTEFTLGFNSLSCQPFGISSDSHLLQL